MKFSQRIGVTPLKIELEKEGLSDDLRNSLWTAFYELILNKKRNTSKYNSIIGDWQYTDLTILFRRLWIHFYKYPIDSLPLNSGCVKEPSKKFVRDWFFRSQWFEIFDFIEFCSQDEEDFKESCNAFLIIERSAYRFVDNVLIKINSQEEVLEIESAINNSDKFYAVKEHLKRSVELYADRKNPDYRNSIKESISAVESLASIIVGDTKITLGQALKKIEDAHQIPNSLKNAFSALYGYTSSEGGIRHSLLEDGVKIEMEEARFMLITCSAFVNYLISKM